MPFHLNKNLTIKGGYDATIDVQDLDNPSVLSGDFNGDDMVSGSGSSLSITGNDENAYHVMVTTNLTSSALIEGFEISGGNADGLDDISYEGLTFDESNGGGMYNVSSSPGLANVTFTANSVNFSGGGMYNGISASPNLMLVTFF